MKIQITNRFTQAVILEGDFSSMKEAVEEAGQKSISLQSADLQSADLQNANLQGANLQNANLQGANLWSANLWSANLWGANLRGANLWDANLRDANLRGADLQNANLQNANLWGADLWEANLWDANLWDANLWGANLRGANLRGADLRDAKDIDLIIAHTRILPEGDIIGYKKCLNNVIVKLKIPANAKRSHAFGRKCRAEFAEVLEVFGAETAVSSYDSTIVYKVGEIVRPDKWSDDWRNECDSGIHFFITKIEAENY